MLVGSCFVVDFFNMFFSSTYEDFEMHLWVHIVVLYFPVLSWDKLVLSVVCKIYGTINLAQSNLFHTIHYWIVFLEHAVS